jgi:serine/threonine-protein kinase HipA
LYDENYDGEAVSLTMPTTQKKYSYTFFPPFEGLPEGYVRGITTY